MLLKNKTAVVTGCNRGIGEKIVEVFSKNGANIFACVRKIDKNFKSKIKKIENKYKNKITPIQLDLSDIEKVKIAAKDIISKCDKVDILINNAGSIYTGLFTMTSSKKLKELFEINFFSQSEFTQYLVKPMLRNKKGNIIFVTSTSGIDGNIGRSAYSSSKASLIIQSKSMAKELGRYNIRVNCVAPGLTDTRMMTENTDHKNIEQFIETTSLKRLALPEEIANVILFLSSDLSSYISGQTIRVDGGI